MQNGMEMIAAQADIEIKALKNSIKMMAKDKIELTADFIDIIAKTRLTINGGGSYEEYAAGKIIKGTTGQYITHATVHSYAPGNYRPTKPVNGDGCSGKEKAADNGVNSVARS